MMRALQKLFRHGNATGVAIPRQMLVKKGWLTGERVIVEELEDDAFLVRRPAQTDMEMLVPSQRLIGKPASVLR